MKDSPEVTARRAALQAFASRCTIPIIASTLDEREHAVEGSGVLYRARGAHFLVTATHVADAHFAGLAHIGLPAKTALERPIDMLSFRGETHDVAIYTLPAEYVEAINASDYWQFVDEDADRDRPVRRDAEFVLHGYPSRMNSVSDKHFENGRLTIWTRHYSGTTDGVSSSAEPQEWDLLLCWPPGADGDYLRGMSGCGVWEAQQPGEGLWTADRGFRPVAVDTGMVRGRWIRTTSWDYVRFLIEQATTPHVEE